MFASAAGCVFRRAVEDIGVVAGEFWEEGIGGVGEGGVAF